MLFEITHYSYSYSYVKCDALNISFALFLQSNLIAHKLFFYFFANPTTLLLVDFILFLFGSITVHRLQCQPSRFTVNNK